MIFLKPGIKFPGLLLITVLMSSSVFAGSVSGILGLGFGVGGDDIDSFYIDGDSEHLKANEGLSIYGGIKYDYDDLLLIKTTLGVKFDTITASNGEANFDRIPLDLLWLLKINRHRLGGGLAYHTAVTYECRLDGFMGCDFEADFEDALGFVVAYEYIATLPEKKTGVSLGVRYAGMKYDYEPSNFPGFTIDASGFDFTMELFF